jgi:hypothetical protein
MNGISAATGACLARIRDLKSRIEERLQHLVRIDEPVAWLGAF